MTTAPRRIVRLTVGDILTGAGFATDQLRITFDVEKINGAEQIATIRIWNLSPENRQLLGDRYTRVIVEYGVSRDDAPVTMYVVFLGQIWNAITARQGADLITTLYARSGLQAATEGTINATFAANLSVGDLVRAVAGEMQKFGVQVGVIDDAIDGIPNETSRGRVLSGSINQVMSNLLEGTGFDFNVQDNFVEVTKAEKQDTAAIVVTPANGLIGSARRTFQGFDFTCLLDPRIRPGMTVGVYSEYADISLPNLHYTKIRTDTGARVLVQAVKHTGTNYDGPATTEITGQL